MQEPPSHQASKKDSQDTPAKEKAKDKRHYGKVLVFLIMLIILFVYYVYTYEAMIRNMTANNEILISLILIFFHILVIFLIWSFYMTMITPPGDIPLFWGFYIGDDDRKRKRYCLICNAFKPERSHHCSVCNRCVLNMDHHCPWVNNCIGFYNRKFFMQLLFYICCTTIYIDISLVYFVLIIVMQMFNMKLTYQNIYHSGIVLVMFCVIFGFSIIICTFFKFHIALVNNNSTTIESLDKEHKEENAKFDLGGDKNWQQVMGRNKLLWLFPLNIEEGRPIGDGLDWETKDTESERKEMSNLNNFGSTNNQLAEAITSKGF